MPDMKPRLRIALLVDPRFPGGTSSAVAAEIRALHRHVDLRVYAVETRMFAGRHVNPRLQAALDECNLEIVWNPELVRADVAVFHNPSCLKFDTCLSFRISCRLAFVVTDENFLRPNGSEGFDIAGCLGILDAAFVSPARFLAPNSACNRSGVEAWIVRTASSWRVAPFDWFNICDFEILAPVAAPRDRRGRHSRPGAEKFPPLATMLAHFPPEAESCVLLGGDMLLRAPDLLPAHWRVLRFGEIPVAEFLAAIDFFVYFTHPLWRESFGRVIAEAIAAGKLVITDPGTAASFEGAVVASKGGDIDAIIRGFIENPHRYRDFVRAAQARLERFRPEAFTSHILANIETCHDAGHALL